jgi:hypothetical protein
MQNLFRLLAVSFCLSIMASGQITPSFVSADQNGIGTSNLLMSSPTGALRQWDVGTPWKDTNTANGTYNWTTFDKLLEDAKVLGVTDVLMTLSETPQWAALRADPNCKMGKTQYACSPPSDIATTDQHWKDFVTAIVNRSESRINGRPHVSAFSTWNEPGWLGHWNGTPAQLARMTKDTCDIVHKLAPGVLCGTPENQAQFGYQMKWWQGLAAAGGLGSVDYVAYHGYTNVYPQKCGVSAIPEDVRVHVANLTALMITYPPLKPLWDTEFSWGQSGFTCFNDPDLQASWVARAYLIQASLGVKKAFWYTSQGDWGGLVAGGKLLPSGVAYKQMPIWLVGATPTNVCGKNGTVWDCYFTKAGGYQSEAVWDTSKTCSGGKCTTGLYAQDAKWKFIRKLDGTRTPTPACSPICPGIPVGIQPILLETQ